MKSIQVAIGTVAVTAIALAAGTQQSAPAKPVAPKNANYAEHVAPLLNKHCVPCHRPGEVAPFSLIGYENAKKWSGMISAVTHRGIMPPWKAEQGYGEFEDENRLDATQLATLKAWHDAGAPRGDAAKEPPTPKFTTTWRLGEPDVVLSPSKPFKLEAEGEDVYRNFVLKSTWDKPVYVKAMDVKPGNAKVVHHVIAFLDRNKQGRKLAEATTDGQEGYIGQGGGVGFIPSGSLGGWAPGLEPRMAKDGIAFKVEPGEEIVLQVHYHKSGKPEEDQTKIGLYFAKEPISKELQLNWIFNFGINIPAGDSSYKARREITWRKDATLYGVMPHMHLVGKSMKSWLEFPDGRIQPLINVPDWDFNWQLTYTFKEPIKVPAGTKQIVEAVYDNSTGNPRNPNNPPKRVTWGEATTDEMFLLIVPFTID